MPSNQTKVLSDDEIKFSQSLPNKGANIFFSGLNSNGEFFIGNRKWNAATGKEIQVFSSGGSTVIDEGATIDIPTVFDQLTVNKLVVNEEIDASTATVKGKEFIGAGSVPIGTVMMWSGRTRSIPQNWRLCNGDYISKTTYSTLYKVYTFVGPNPHGADVGDTFKLPDLRSKFITGAGAGGTPEYAVGNTGGENSVTLNITQIPSHNHSLDNRILTEGVPGPGFGGQTIDSSAPIATTGDTGGGQPHENRPPYYALLYKVRVS